MAIWNPLPRRARRQSKLSVHQGSPFSIRQRTASTETTANSPADDRATAAVIDEERNILPVSEQQNVGARNVRFNEGNFTTVRTEEVIPELAEPLYFDNELGEGTALAPQLAPRLIQESSSGGSISGSTTYYCVITFGNKRGETTPSPETSLTLGAGSTFQLYVSPNANEVAQFSGCYKMRAYIGTASGGPYYLQTPRNLTYSVDTAGSSFTISTISRTNDIIVAVTTAAHGMVFGDLIYVSGVTDTSFNGVFTVLAVPNSTTLMWLDIGANASDSTGTILRKPAAVRFGNVAYLRFASAVGYAKYSKVTITGVTDATFNASDVEIIDLGFDSQWIAYSNTGADGTSSSGTVTQTTALDTNWHYIGNDKNTNDIILDSLTLSGTQPPSSNSAVIDSLQVLVNKATTGFGTAVNKQTAKGIVYLKNKTYTLTTPLVLGLNPPRITGVGPALDLSQVSLSTVLSNNWSADEHVGTVMVMGRNVTLEFLSIHGGTGSNALMFVAGSHDMNSFYGRGLFLKSNTSSNALIAPIRMRNVGFTDTMIFDGVTTQGGRFVGLFMSNCGEVTELVLRNGRLNALNGASSPASTAIVNAAGAQDTDRGGDNLQDPTSSSPTVVLDNIVTESTKGITFDWGGGELRLINRTHNADSVHTSGTECVMRLWRDGWQPGGTLGLYIDPTVTLFSGGANCQSTIRLRPGSGYRLIILGEVQPSSGSGASWAIDMGMNNASSGSYILGQGGGTDGDAQIVHKRVAVSSTSPPSSGFIPTILAMGDGNDGFGQRRVYNLLHDKVVLDDAYRPERRRTFLFDYAGNTDTLDLLASDDSSKDFSLNASGDWTFRRRVHCKRLFGSGTALVAGDFVLSGGWGAGAAVSAVTGTDMAWQITVTAGGAPGPNPTVTLTFKDGTFTNVPICQTKMVGGTGAYAFLSDAPTATTNVITYQGTPVAGLTYILSGYTIGR